MLDVSRRVWWQAHASGAYPRPRAGHAAVRIGGDLLFFGGAEEDDQQETAPTLTLSLALALILTP